MLCASEQVFAPAAHPHPPSPPPQQAGVPLLQDPHDPNIDVEYERLVNSWNYQLFSHDTDYANSPTTTTQDGSSVKTGHYMAIVDRYLDEQWLDAQRMLRCAQAWSMRQTLCRSEAVHTINILSLRMMQRSMHTRQALYGGCCSFPRSSSPPLSSTPSLSSLPKTAAVVQHDAPHGMVADRVALSDEDDDEQEMHAPLLRRHQTNSSTWTPEKLQKKPSLETLAAAAAAAKAVPSSRVVRLAPSPSAPNMQHELLSHCPSHFMPFYGYSPPWRRLGTDSASNTSSIMEEDDGEWRSWFHPSQDVCAFCRQPMPAKRSFSAGDAETTRLVPSSSSSSDDEEEGMVRCESSISAFRPIRKNLAPRCEPTVLLEEEEEEEEGLPMLTKSRSFPTKEAAAATSASNNNNKKSPSNFVMRSIVNKKASLSKLFSGKK